MLDWIFKKKSNTPASAPAVAAKSPPPVAAPPGPAVDWTARLAQARGDDDALLALLRAAGVPLQFKQAAVEALGGEAALKLAEREFRSHDRRVHQLAKRRLLAKVAQRQTREQAARLIETARCLVSEADVPVNRGVELDHAWQALDGAAIEPAERDEFAALTAQLAAHLRRRADIELQRKRWHADVVSALPHLLAACAEAAAGTQDRASLAGAAGTARGVVEAQPPNDAPAPATLSALADLRHALRIAAALDGHLAVLDRLLAQPAEAAPRATGDRAAGPGVGGHPKAEAVEEVGAEEVDAEGGTEEGGTEGDKESAVPLPPVDDPQREWLALPPLPDTHLAALLEARHGRWQQAREQARHERQSLRREQALERQRARKGERGAALAECVALAEAALDAGQLADAHRHLSDIDDALQAADAPDALRARIAAAQARLAQLRGWQHWAGGRARDELVLQAEALAAATVGGGDGKGGGEGEGNGEGKGEGGGQSASEVDAEVARLSIRQRAEVIDTLRARWKEIDRLGGAGGRALWQRFDAALKVAGEPVAAHIAAQRAARETNLSARRQLLDVLEALDVAAITAPAESAAPAVPADDVAQSETKDGVSAEAPTDVRALASALDRFHAEWRKLGPLEHTVPRAARAALVERMEAAVRRVEAPLQAARRRARTEREVLVARARAIGNEAPGRGRDLVGAVRALQAEWQQHAKALPLARADEQALWTDFKAAIDAAFAAREAVFSAREAECEAHAAERAALIERLRVRPEDSGAAQRRTLAEVEAAWQRCGPAPSARAAALDAEFRAARDALRQWLDDSAQRTWQATCDALDAKLALCLALEQGAAGDGANGSDGSDGADGADGADVDETAVAASWHSLPVLPAPLEDALRRRAGLAPTAGTHTAPAIDDLLLQIETAWDLPTPAAFESARRERKLLAMKAALEARRADAPAALPPDAALAHLLACGGLDAGQRDRLVAVLAARRRRGPQRPA